MGEVFALKDVTQGVDITPYVTSYTWSGSLGQAARKLDFVIISNWSSATVWSSPSRRRTAVC